MKTMTGFVTNSSSTSFVIAVRPGMKPRDIVNKIELAFELPKGHILTDISRHIAEQYIQRGVEGGDPISPDDIDLNEYSPDWLRKAFEKGWAVFEGAFSTDGDPLEQMLTEAVWGITYSDDDIAIGAI
jgi:hypothetical protein